MDLSLVDVIYLNKVLQIKMIDTNRGNFYN
jgi:hypothetical protein